MTVAPQEDYYALLGVAPQAGPDEIRRAYGERVRTAMDDRPRFEALQAAFEALRDPERRADYDRTRGNGNTRVGEMNRMSENEPTMAGSVPPTAGSGGSTLMGGATVAATPTMMGIGGGERTQAVSLGPCPVCGTPDVPGEEFCVECGFLVGSAAGDEAVVRPLPRLIDQAGREFPLKLGENMVGREGADVMLPDRTVSRRHARVVVEETGTVWMEDLGSTNGTRFSGAPLPAGRQTSLSDRTAIQFGSIKLTVILPEGFERDLLALPPPTAAAADAEDAPAAALPAPEGVGNIEQSAARLIDKGGTEQPLMDERTTLGRRPGNSIIISDDSFVSGSHAEIVYDRGQFFVADLGSTNGTKLNGRKLLPNVPNPLADGDELTLGQTMFTFRAPAAS